MSVFLLVISAIALIGIIGEKDDKSKLYFTLAFAVSVAGAVLLKAI